MVSMLLSPKVNGLRNYFLASLPVFVHDAKRVYHLTYEDVLDAHFSIADFFYRDDYGLGGVGFRDVQGFVSTVERQFLAFQSDIEDDEFETIASLMFGNVKNHPFFDANKRTDLLCMLLQLHRLGRVPTSSEKEMEDFVVAIADDTMKRKSVFKELNKRKVERPEIKYIAMYLKKNSRKTARLNSMLRFRELRSLLERNGFRCGNSWKGTIDVIHTTERRIPRFFLGDRIEKKEVVVANISYHGENAEVPDATLKYVRQVCGLTDQDGFDGDVLFRDKQPTFQLINSYRTALQNLAYR